jgi:hypothetical protein
MPMVQNIRQVNPMQGTVAGILEDEAADMDHGTL